jgi:hypothetical protein
VQTPESSFDTCKKSRDCERKFHFVTGTEYFNTYQKIEVRPIAAICKSICYGKNHKQEEFEQEDRGKKAQILSDLMSARALVSPDLRPFAFNKRNKKAQAQLVQRRNGRFCTRH